MRAKKSLGQNFLKSKEALRDMISAGNISKKDVVLEIGPGKGVLTEKLLENAGKVIAIEKDEELFLLLKEKFAKEIHEKKLDLISGDIMEFDPSVLDANYKVIANIPYYLTGAIFRKFLENKSQPAKIVLLVQKEVAERIVVRDKKESILSISVKAYGKPKYIAKVSKKYFSPAPKVDSAIIEVSDISKNNFKNLSEEEFFEVVRSGFAHKRKTLLKNLDMAGFDREILEVVWTKLKIPEKARPENVGIEAWFNLAKEIHSKEK